MRVQNKTLLNSKLSTGSPKCINESERPLKRNLKHKHLKQITYTNRHYATNRSEKRMFLEICPF